MPINQQSNEALQIVPASRNYFIDQLKQTGQWYEKNLIVENISIDVIQAVEKNTVEEYQVLPVEFEANPRRLLLVTGLEKSLRSIAVLSDEIGCPVQILMADPQNVRKAIEHYYGVTVSNTDDTQTTLVKEEPLPEKDDWQPEENSPIVAKVESILRGGLNHKATDIHIMPGYNGSWVLFRINKRLINVSADYPISPREKRPVVNVIKNMCGMDTANNVLPEDGSANFIYQNRAIDFRVSVLPTVRGQKVVIRLLDTSKTPLNLDQLGFSDLEQKTISRAAIISSGLFVVTGPVSSGKSTTIHAILKRYNGLEHNTVTIENPVEYQDEHITQIQVRDVDDKKLCLDGKKILKEILRQDPDNILYGEIRDEIDAKVVIEAAQTGHRVFSTLHTKDAPSALYRLFGLGVEKRTLLNELNCIISQRLVALNCPHCAVEHSLTEDEKALLLPHEEKFLSGGVLREVGPGCSHCNHGTTGLTVVAEFILFDNQLRDFLQQKVGIQSILEQLRDSQGFQTLWEKGLELVQSGRVSFSELLRVIAPSR